MSPVVVGEKKRGSVRTTAAPQALIVWLPSPWNVTLPVIGVIFIVLGLALMVATIRLFVTVGKGTGSITLGQETHRLRPGSVAVIPAGVLHSLEASEELEFVIFGTPPMSIDDERARPRKG